MANLKMTLRLAAREILRHRSFSLFLVLNMALGLLGFVTLDAFKTALSDSVSARSRILLGADIAISGRRPLTDEERGAVDKIIPTARRSELVELYSMVRAGSKSRLVQLRAVDGEFPLYGELKLETDGALTRDAGRKLSETGAGWAYPELFTQLGLSPGDKLLIGERSFFLRDRVLDEPSTSSVTITLAPRIYVALSQLPETKLIRPGSTATYRLLYRVSDGVDLRELQKTLEAAITDPAIHIVSHLDSNEQVARLVQYLGDYLGLAAIVAFFLSGLGSAYLFRSYLTKRLRDVAILTSLGLGPRRTTAIYLWQLTLLALVASVPAILGGRLLLPLLIQILRTFLPFDLAPHVAWGSALLAAVLSASGTLLICLPLLWRMRSLSPSALFYEGAFPLAPLTRRGVIAFLPTIFFYWTLAIWQAKSWKVGSLFLASLIVATAAALLLGSLILKALERYSVHSPFVTKLAFRNLARNRVGALSSFLAILLGTMLINLITQIQTVLEEDIQHPELSALPSLFLFDIQEEQLDGLQRYVASEGALLKNPSPLIRSRIQSVNGQAFEKDTERQAAETREEEGDRRFRRIGINLTFRESLPETEEIVSGTDFLGKNRLPPHEPWPISLERDFAKRMKLKIGDDLVFDVQGVPVAARVANLRKIRWTSFQPAFFTLFPPGALEDAPKIYVASLPPLPTAQKEKIQSGIVERFSNVSIVDITRVVDKILSILKQMGWALKFMAYLTIFAGFIVLYSIASHQAELRKWDTTLLKVLGASFGQVSRINALEFGLIGFGASVLGVFFSFLASYLLAHFLFDKGWQVSGWVPVLSVILTTAGSLLTARWAARRTLLRSPLVLLQTR